MPDPSGTELTASEQEIVRLRAQVAAQQRELERLRAGQGGRQAADAGARTDLDQHARSIRALNARIDALVAERDRVQQSLSTLLASRKWRALHVLGRIRERLAPYGTRRAAWVAHALDVLLRRPKHLRVAIGADGRQRGIDAELQSILDAHPDRRGILVYPPLIDWGWMKQRPHHLVAEFARVGYLVFFCPPQSRTDFVAGFTRVAERLYLCGRIERLYELPEPIVLLSKPQHYAPICHFRQPTIIYDCLDDLSVHSATGQVDRKALQTHKFLLEAAAVVCATSQPLWEEARQTRADVLLCPNAAEFDHFHLTDDPPVPADLAPVLKSQRPIVGYYGALAQWFDFELLYEVAARCAECEFVLIGPDYDGAVQVYKARRPANVHFLGEKRYDDLPAYLHYFAVATIPFRINSITQATSPIKLFEYMAAGKPVVTTRLPECCRQPEVLTAGDAGEFAARLHDAMRLRSDPEHTRKLIDCARQNSWAARFAALHARLVPPNVRPLAHVRAALERSRGAVVFPRSIDWGVDLYQRPHHLARYFARRGYVAIYCGGQRDGCFTGFREIEPNLYVFRGSNELLREIPTPLLWCFCYNFHLKDRFPGAREVVYDLIDEPEVHPFDRSFLQRNHERALREATLVTYVAHALERHLKTRPDAIYLPNGVEDQHFATEAPRPEDPELRDFLTPAAPVAGYYGALARWFDYDLLEHVARRKGDWRFLLIGPDYDQSSAGHPLQKCTNVLWLGPRPYAKLPAYLRLFDVATIPFQINAITRATSPLKLYEYFAGGKPVVTTALPECRGFPEVRIAAGVEEFCAALDAAGAQGQDPAFCARLRAIAAENSWARRVETVEEHLRR